MFRAGPPTRQTRSLTATAPVSASKNLTRSPSQALAKNGLSGALYTELREVASKRIQEYGRVLPAYQTQAWAQRVLGKPDVDGLWGLSAGMTGTERLHRDD
jgi:hypothetical protein